MTSIEQLTRKLETPLQVDFFENSIDNIKAKQYQTEPKATALSHESFAEVKDESKVTELST